MRFEFKKNVVLEKKFLVNGREYESLDQVPAEARAAIEKVLGGDAASATKITVNGHTYGSANDLPAPLKAVVNTLALMALKKAGAPRAEVSEVSEVSDVGQVRPEPVLSMQKILIVIGLAALVIWIARALF